MLMLSIFYVCVYMYIIMCIDYRYAFYLVRSRRDYPHFIHLVATKIVTLAIYQWATNVGHVSSPIINQDLELLKPFIKLWMAYEDSMRRANQA
jgi:hypothetical protein